MHWVFANAMLNLTLKKVLSSFLYDHSSLILYGCFFLLFNFNHFRWYLICTLHVPPKRCVPAHFLAIPLVTWIIFKASL
jgi:hypothetical protein